MSDEKKEPWLNLLALTTVILAVCATLATFRGGGYSTRTVLSQSHASDQWAYYQAKGIKGNLYEVEAMRLKRELQLAPKATLLNQKPVYYLGLVVGVVGIVSFINGFLLFIPA